MGKDLNYLIREIYKNCMFELSEVEYEIESKDYNACKFTLNNKRIISRKAKKTPKKKGQFVTFWKRSENGPIAPFDETDQFDFFIVNVQTENNYGQFVFPKSTLIKNGIITSKNRPGKRAFRVYPKWDSVKSGQAEKTQKWQLDYFYPINDSTDLNSVMKLYNVK
ncbi:MepB family protein [Echinicola shivajiensis]|uniref:MepB family protein n=1 Tax=Echinicola shivajiensis TaxID=1035916 RepID=UPI001BFC84E3|nr:MepB family protein [Echinicola shivajiensis]